MRKRIFGRRLKRDANERKALFKGLMSQLVLKERIKTTEAKAKAIRGQVEKLVTKARTQTNSARVILERFLIPSAIEKMMVDVAPRFANRPGGYTRIIKLNSRIADNAPLVMMEWVEQPKSIAPTPKIKGITGKEKATAQKAEVVPVSKATKETKKEAPKKTTRKKKEVTK